MYSFGKCQSCGQYQLLRVFWYNGLSTTPDYLCDSCMREFDEAMIESDFWTLYGRGLEDPDWDADAACKQYVQDRMQEIGYEMV